MRSENRTRSSALPQDRPRQDQAEPAQVHHARRDDRQEGQGPGLDPAAADRHPAVPLRQQGAGGVGQGDGDAGQAARRAPQGERRGQGRRSAAASTSSRSSSRWRSWPRSSARSWRCRASSPRARRTSSPRKDKYTGIRQAGPESLRHFKRTYKQALKRQIASTPTTRTTRWSSRSARTSSIARWNRVRSPTVERRHHLHDGRLGLDDRRAEGDRPHRGVLDRHLAQEPVRGRRDPLHHPRRGGPGGRRAPSTTPASRAARGSARPTSWPTRSSTTTIPPTDGTSTFHFSDGDNWGETTRQCIDLLTEKLLPKFNLFGYGQVESPYGSGEFIKDLSTARSTDADEPPLLGDPEQGRDLSTRSRIPGKGRQMTMSHTCRRTSVSSRRRSRSYASGYGLDFFEIIFEVLD